MARATPQVMRVDGSLFDNSGLPLTAGKDIQIKTYDAASGGTLLWTSTVYNTNVVGGKFTVNLNAASGSPSLVDRLAAAGSAQGMYFQIEVDTGVANGVMNAAAVVLPRMRAKGTSFALSAASADALRGVTATSIEMNYLVGLTASVQSQVATAMNSGGATTLLYGGRTGWRAAPTSGTLTGEYWTSGAWATTGAITCNRCRLHFMSGVTVAHAITVNTEMAGGRADAANCSGLGGPGGGLGGAGSYGSTTGGGGGGGGGHGGRGGYGGSASAGKMWGGEAYSAQDTLSGSGGAGGSCTGNSAPGAGGAGGGALYIEAAGNVQINANISANGASGTAGTSGLYGGAGGGGGSGGGIDIRSLGTVNILSGVTVAARGASGGNGTNNTGVSAGGGGGGGGGIVFVRGATVTNNGTIDVSGGAVSSGGSTAPEAGSIGVSDVASEVWGPRGNI